MWICIALRFECTSEALRCGTRSQGISQFYLHTPCLSTNGMNHTCLFIPSWRWSSFTDPGGMEGWVDLTVIYTLGVHWRHACLMTLSLRQPFVSGHEPYLPFLTSSSWSSFTDPGGMEGWVDLTVVYTLGIRWMHICTWFCHCGSHLSVATGVVTLYF